MATGKTNKIKAIFFSIFCLLALPNLSSSNDYTGIWKGNCSDFYGLQIKPVKNDLYSIKFCGLRGCIDQWTPDTPIERDPKYTVISPSEITIGSKNKYKYKKCSNNPAWISPEPEPTELRKLPDCPFTKKQEQGVLIAWITNTRETTQFGSDIETRTIIVGPFRPLALLTGHSLKEAPGNNIFKEQTFWQVLSPKTKPVILSSVASFYDTLNDGACVYYGSINKKTLPTWTLLSSQPLPGVFHAPTAKEMETFDRLNTTCQQQGDHPEGKSPPCTRPKLLAVTDINKNSKPQYWATEPYIWDDGLTVWEEKDGRLIPLIQVCVGCSD